jgi:hypothetical protein
MRSTHPTRVSLVNVRPGDVIEVVSISLRDRVRPDSHHHIHRGVQWTCRTVGSATILLLSSNGRAIRVPCDTARLIQIEPATRSATGEQ